MKKSVLRIIEIISTVFLLIAEAIFSMFFDKGLKPALFIIASYIIVMLCFTFITYKRRNRSVEKLFDEYENNDNDEDLWIKVTGCSKPRIPFDYLKEESIICNIFYLNEYYSIAKDSVSEDKEEKILKLDSIWETMGDVVPEEKLEKYVNLAARISYAKRVVETKQRNDEFYFELDYRQVNSEQTSSETSLIDNLVNNGISAAFFANGGYGKTFTLERIAGLYCEKYLTNVFNAEKAFDEKVISNVPILLYVKDCAISDNPIVEYFNSKILKRNVYIRRATLKACEFVPKSIVIIDALDEAKAESINTNIMQNLNSAGTLYISGRYSHKTLLNELTDDEKVSIYTINRVTSDKIEEYFTKRLTEVDAKTKAPRLTNDEVEYAINEYKKNNYFKIFESPFIMFCFCNYLIEEEIDNIKTENLSTELVENEIYRKIVVEIIRREMRGKGFRKIPNVEIVYRYLNALAVAMNKIENSNGITAVKAKECAKDFFENEAILLDTDEIVNSINETLYELHILDRNEENKYKFYVNGFMLVLIDEKEIDQFINESATAATLDTDARINYYLTFIQNKVAKEDLSVLEFFESMASNPDQYGGIYTCMAVLSRTLRTMNVELQREFMLNPDVSAIFFWAINHVLEEKSNADYIMNKNIYYIMNSFEGVMDAILAGVDPSNCADEEATDYKFIYNIFSQYKGINKRSGDNPKKNLYDEALIRRLLMDKSLEAKILAFDVYKRDYVSAVQGCANLKKNGKNYYKPSKAYNACKLIKGIIDEEIGISDAANLKKLYDEMSGEYENAVMVYDGL